jgi:hypothetical protein
MQININTSKVDNDYQQIVQGNRVSDCGCVYTLDYIREILWYYEDNEDYEKCSKLITVINCIKDHNHNYTK